MTKFALYTKFSNENKGYISSISMRSLAEARAYFIGMKRLTPEQFDQQFEVDIIQETKNASNKGLMFGNQ
jgi:hypothetical protein